MTLDANSSVTVLQNGPCLTQKTPSVSTIEASHDANRSVTVAKGLRENVVKIYFYYIIYQFT